MVKFEDCSLMIILIIIIYNNENNDNMMIMMIMMIITLYRMGAWDDAGPELAVQQGGAGGGTLANSQDDEYRYRVSH